MRIDEIRTLCVYNAWANDRILDACAALTPDELVRERGSSHASIRATLAHLVGAEWLWLERWQGRSPAGLPADTDPTELARLRARAERTGADVTGFLAALDDAGLQAEVRYRTTEGAAHAQPLWELLLHVVNHGTYHRGQVAALLRQAGVKPPATDLVVFLRERARNPSR